MELRRTKLITTLAATAALCAASLGLAPAAQASPDPSCGDTVTTSVALTATLDCTGYSGGAVLTAGADGITIDLRGFSIVGTDGFASGVDVSGRAGVTVRNGSIDGPSGPGQPAGPFGVQVRDSSGIRLENLLVHDTGVDADDSGWGVWVESSANVRLNRVTAVRSESTGAGVARSTGVVVTKSSFSDNANDGMLLDGGSGVQIVESRFDGNVDGDGLEVTGTEQVQVSRSSLSRNGQSGLEVDFTHVRVNGCTVVANRGDGVLIGKASAEVQGSSLSYNGGSGLYAVYAGFQVTDSEVLDNAVDGVHADRVSNFLIKRVRALLNDRNGVFVIDNTSPQSLYRVEYTVSNLNRGAGFVIEYPVIGKRNTAAGNGTSNWAP